MQLIKLVSGTSKWIVPDIAVEGVIATTTVVYHHFSFFVIIAIGYHYESYSYYSCHYNCEHCFVYQFGYLDFGGISFGYLNLLFSSKAQYNNKHCFEYQFGYIS